MKNRVFNAFLVICCTLYFGMSEVLGQCASCDYTYSSASGDPDVGGTVPWNSDGKTFCITAENRTGSIVLRNAKNATICISENTVFTGGFLNLSNPTSIYNYGQIGTDSAPINLSLGLGSHFINQGIYYGNFTSNNGAKITNRNSIFGNITLNSPDSPNPTPTYINSGSQTGNLNLYSGTVNNSGALTLNNFNFSSSTVFSNTGNTIVKNNLGLNGILSNSGNFSVVGNISGNSSSSITNSGNISSTGNFESNSTVNSSSGNIYVGGKLTVNGSSLFKSGNTNVDGDLENNGQILISGQLSINGNTVNNGSGVISGGSNESCNGFLVQGPTFTNYGAVGSVTFPLNVSKNATNQYAPSFGGNATIGECGCTPKTAFSSEFEVIIVYNCPGNYTWSPPEGLTKYEVLVVGGGGAGGNSNTGNSNKSAGGGGAGAVKYQVFNIAEPGLISSLSYTVIVGDGGKANGSNTASRNGQNSTFNNGSTLIISGGGGAGGFSNDQNGQNGTSNSSGGGAGAQSTNQEGNGGSGIFNGGNSKSSGNSTNQFGGGGGGNSSIGNVGNSNGRGGDGGSGSLISIGFSTTYGGGGGGGAGSTNNIGLPGLGGGGLGGNENTIPTNGLPNTGGGGGGAGGNNKSGGDGGSGVVIIRYETAKILPVELLSFNVTYQTTSNSTLLSWSTAKEWENSHFEIERAVNTIKEWETLGEEEGFGFSNEPSTYQFEDSNLPATGGNIFYRLKQVDYSGNFSYSITRSVQIDPLDFSTFWKIYPNPTDGSTFTMDLVDPSSIGDGSISVRVITTLGSFQSFSGNNPEEISDQIQGYLESQIPGLYTIQILWANQQEIHKIVKK